MPNRNNPLSHNWQPPPPGQRPQGRQGNGAKPKGDPSKPQAIPSNGRGRRRGGTAGPRGPAPAAQPPVSPAAATAAAATARALLSQQQQQQPSSPARSDGSWAGGAGELQLEEEAAQQRVARVRVVG